MYEPNKRGLVSIRREVGSAYRSTAGINVQIIDFASLVSQRGPYCKLMDGWSSYKLKQGKHVSQAVE